ncbi:hypothetical protein ETX26_04095 [Pelagerythrobacter rhizovicinus]|uniref:Glycerophosphoryl diester phosphodiesterase membrane domain-containing protein n=1 Tax=Pelagerythrobacter rhizovicinus TaxID=2268576 RepID=A0A4Q2KQP4_9SPHN|nr:hypothetical protein ETX26_04095 [Pelagerythrobacter rhizovicinus]
MLVFVIVVGGLGAVSEIGGATDPDRLWGFGFTFDAGTTILGGIAGVAALIAHVVGSYLILERMLELRGRVGSGGTRIWAYVGLALLTGFGMILGLLFLIVPGLILAVRWSAASGFLIARRAGVIEAMGASWNVTRGHSWPIFFAGLVCFLLALVPIVAVSSFIEFAGAGPVGAAIGTGLTDAITTAVFLPLGISVFTLLDEGTQEIGEVFA